MNFEPRQVSSESWKHWIHQALELTHRKLPQNLLLLILIPFFPAIFLIFGTDLPSDPTVAGVSWNWGMLMLTVMVWPEWSILIFIRCGYSADKNLSVYQSLGVPRRSGCINALLWIGVRQILLAMFLVVMTLAVVNSVETELGSQPQWQAFQTKLLISEDNYLLPFINWYSLFFISYLLFTGATSTWFLFPVMAFFNLSLKESFYLSRHATLLNIHPCTITLSITSIIAILLSMGSYVLVLPTLPIMGALLYVSFRDVFLGIPENKKVDVAEKSFSVQSQSSSVR